MLRDSTKWNFCILLHLLLWKKKVHRRVRVNRLYKANIFNVSFFADLCKFPIFHIVARHCHYFISMYFRLLPCMDRDNIKTLGVWERLRKLSKDSISLVVCPYLLFSCYFLYALYLRCLTSLGEPYWCMNINPSDKGARLYSCDFRLGLYW